jgi:hypothetical protein
VSTQPIHYFLVRPADFSGRATLPNLLEEGELYLLRCFMTLLLLPSDLSEPSSSEGRFTSALRRLHFPPSFRTLFHSVAPPPLFLQDLRRAAANIFMLNDSAPEWLLKIGEDLDIGILTPRDDLVGLSASHPKIHVGVLKGAADLPESYRVISEIRRVRTDGSDRFVQSTGEYLSNRPRLDFIPPVPLPPPSHGRSAAYLVNRYSNNVDVPGIAAKAPESCLYIPQLLEWCRHAGATLASFEQTEDVPQSRYLDLGHIRAVYDQLESPSIDNGDKFKAFASLGLKLSNGVHLRRPLVGIGAPRMDLIQGRVPSSVPLDRDHRRAARGMRRAIRDRDVGTSTEVFENEHEREWYEGAQFTLVSEERLISCQMAWLSARPSMVPLQLPSVSGTLYNAAANLNAALEHNSRKIPSLFRDMQNLLAGSIPQEFLNIFSEDSTPIVLFSDLPYEWMMLGEWPLCMVRPVSRIPLGQSRWDTLSAALESRSTVDVTKPERVLVFDLIHPDDPIRSHSDAFSAASSAIDQHYTYAHPANAQQFKDVLNREQPEIVVLDTHASYDRRSDQLRVSFGRESELLDDLIPERRVPPVWILSACDTSVTGAVRGSFVRKLLSRGAVCVVATLNRVDAGTASMFLGRLLTEVYSPVRPRMYSNFGQAFFAAQYTTALLYDTLIRAIFASDRLGYWRCVGLFAIWFAATVRIKWTWKA